MLNGIDMRLACHQFLATDVEALRSLLRLLESYLRNRWEVVERIDRDIDLVLVNLDHPAPAPLPDGLNRIDCAARPRLRHRACIHRPLRASEILTVLNDAVSAEARPVCAAVSAPTGRHRLAAWPLQLDGWHDDALRILATLTSRAATQAEIVAATGVAPARVDVVLSRLRDQGLLELATQRVPPAPRIVHGNVVPGRWRALATRVGRLLGLPA
ncbi:hypothetical protein [Pseudofulvimonas gallinarii]|nr:hypothetical protein [Pseudofulvimonas gallinarii]